MIVGNAGGKVVASMRLRPNTYPARYYPEIMCRNFLLALLLVAGCVQSADTLQGKVVSIADGDTLTLLNSTNQQIKVRLAEIDTPEMGQPYGNRAKQALSGMVFGKEVSVVVQGMDRYGRTVGRVYVDELDVNAEMVRIGAAWVYRQYLKDQSLLKLEGDAREAKVGIWGLLETQQIPPWEWRRSGGTEGAPEGCLIKGNISKKGDRIYHVPGSRSYGPTRINESKGERWFCSEEEARQAGWREPRN